MASQFPAGDRFIHRVNLKLCDCGCGGYPRGRDFMPGHEMHVIKALIDHVGSIRNLREVVEQYTGKAIVMPSTEGARQVYRFNPNG